MNSLIKKIKKNSKNDMISELMNAEVLNEKEIISTEIPALNIALSGSIDGGFTSGVTTLAGKSKSFKTLFALEMAKGFLKKHDDAILVFFDSEFGSPLSYFESFGDSKDRILHVPVTTVEELRTEVANQLNGLDREDKVIFIIDSIGNLASIKETEDALDGKQVVDMTRAKAIKSFFRIVTPKLVLKNIPMITINHTYDCGTADMLVKTPNGSVSLADLKVGDDVYTTNGIEQVSYAVKHEDATITDIELENGEILSFVGNHRFKVNGEWKFVHDIRVGDDLDVLET